MSSGVRRSPSAEEIEATRHSLGLSHAKPSEQVAGLEEAGRRAEQRETRAELRRQDGGKIVMNAAVLVDETGRRWSRFVKRSLLGSLGTLLLVGVVLIWVSNRKPVDPRDALRVTANRLTNYEKRYAPYMPPFPEEARVTAELFEAKLTEFMKQELKGLELAAQLEEQTRGSVQKDTKERIQRLVEDLLFQDGSGQRISFEMDGEQAVVVQAKGVDPVKIPILREKPKKLKKSPAK